MPDDFLKQHPYFRPLFIRVTGQVIHGQPVYVDFVGKAAKENDTACDVTNGAAAIRLQREECASPTLATILLAHEYGHALSWRDGNPTARAGKLYRRASMGKCVTRDGGHVVLDEECRAWIHAERVLTELAFPHMDEFHREKERRLEVYCDGLQLDRNRWKERLARCATAGAVVTRP